MKCRCGHGRHKHFQSRNAIMKQRARGLKPTGRLSCWANVADRRDAPWKCPCRNYVPVAA